MCGDGANDCGALKAAHTGISLSEAESSVASPFTSKNPNITCVIDVIKEGRAALVTSFGIFKYMAAYSLCQFVSVLILYSIDSNLTDLEFLYIDLFIISIFAFFFGRSGAYSGKLVKQTPLTSLINMTPVLSLLGQVGLIIIFQVVAFLHLRSESWYEPFDHTKAHDKDDNACTENFTIFTISSFQYIILAIVFSKGKPYRTSIFRNYGFIISAVALTGFSIYLAVYPTQFLQQQFQLALPESLNFRLYLLLYALVNFILSLLLENVIVEYVIFKKCRYKFHNIEKSKRKYLRIERELERDTKWPVLTSDFKSAASPQNPEPTCHAEIVIERENFDKDHVLNKLYESIGGGAFELVDGVQRSFSLDLGDLGRSDVPKQDSNAMGQSIPNVRQHFGTPLHKLSIISSEGNNFENILEDCDVIQGSARKNGEHTPNTSPLNKPQFEFVENFAMDNGFMLINASPSINDDIPFSSLPSEHNITSTSDTFQSVPSQNTSYDVAHSHFNIDELPYDNSKVLLHTSEMCNSNSKRGYNSFPNSPQRVCHDGDVMENISSFNSLGRTPKTNNDNALKALEMNSFENR